MRPGRLLMGSLVAGLALALTAGCGGSDPNQDSDPFNDNPAKEGTVSLNDRPSMETILGQYRAFQADLLDRLDEAFGPKVWATSHGEDQIESGGCDDDNPAWENVGLPRMEFKGAYPRAAWHGVRDLVVEVGKKHGFTEITPLLDQTDALNFFGHDPRFGGRYYFGIGKYTVLGIDTGCHRWNNVPSPSPAP